VSPIILRRDFSRQRAGTAPHLSGSRLAEVAEEGPHVGDEEIGFLNRGEVAAAVELRPAHDVVGLLSEMPQRDEDLVRKDGDCREDGRRFDLRRYDGVRRS
jgi:hypothetical protein